jgi:hypothetical protein
VKILTHFYTNVRTEGLEGRAWRGKEKPRQQQQDPEITAFPLIILKAL